MLMFLIYALVLYICSIGFSFFIKKDSKIYLVKNIIGFLLLLLILQIGYYPMQYFKVSSTITNTWTLVIILISFILGILNISKKDFSFFKSYEFWTITVLIFIVLKIVPGIDAGDDSFYMSLFMDNSNIKSINSINPRTGIIGKIDSVYLYQGFYLLMSFIYRVQNVLFSNSINNIFISYRSTISLLSCIYLAQIYIYLRNTYLVKGKKLIFYLVELLSLLLIGSLELTHIYWGSFFIFPICMSLFIIIFNLYIKDEKYKYMLFIINAACISLASSSLFLIPIITFGYFVYDLLNKNAKCLNYYIILIPSFIYISFLFNKLFLILIILCLLLLIIKFNKNIDKIINGKFKYLLTLIPITFIILGLLGDYSFFKDSYRVSKIMLLFNILILVYTLFLLIKKQKINPVLVVISVITVFFFNPLVEPIVAHKLTSTFVYYRLFYITKNPAVIVILFMFIYEYIEKVKYKKILRNCFIIVVCLLSTYYVYCLFRNTNMLNTYKTPYNYLVREDNYSYELGSEVSKLKKNSKIFSVYFAPRMYNKDLITDVARYPDDYDLWYKDIKVQVLYRFKKISNKEYAWFKDSVKKYDYLITYNKNNIKDKLNKNDFNIVYENDMYVLIKVLNKGE